MRYKKAFVVGKCLPPHKGHVALLRFAACLADHVVFAVEEQKNEALFVDVRRDILKRDAPPNVEVVSLRGHHPASSDECESPEAFWKYWQAVVADLAPHVDCVVSGDEYGARLASDQGAAWVPYPRSVLPFSATSIKENIWENFDKLAEGSQDILSRKVWFVGAESTGKSTLARWAAAKFGLAYRPEYAEDYLRRNPQPITPELLEFFASAQTAQSVWPSQVVLEDSSILTTALYAQQFGFNDLAGDLFARARLSKPDLIVMPKIKGAVFVHDDHRVGQAFNQKWEENALDFCQDMGWPVLELEGNWNTRQNFLQKELDSFIKKWKEASFEEWAPPAVIKNKFIP